MNENTKRTLILATAFLVNFGVAFTTGVITGKHSHETTIHRQVVGPEPAAPTSCAEIARAADLDRGALAACEREVRGNRRLVGEYQKLFHDSDGGTTEVQRVVRDLANCRSQVDMVGRQLWECQSGIPESAD